MQKMTCEMSHSIGRILTRTMFLNINVLTHRPKENAVFKEKKIILSPKKIKKTSERKILTNAKYDFQRYTKHLNQI